MKISFVCLILLSSFFVFAQSKTVGKSNSEVIDSSSFAVTESDFFYEINGKLVDLRKSTLFSKSDKLSRATAFYAKMNNKVFIPSFIKIKKDEMFSGFSLEDGSTLEMPSKVIVAAGKNVLISPAKRIPKDAIIFDMAKQVDSFVELGDDVLVVGYHDANDYVQLKKSKVSSFSSSSIEISPAEFSLSSIGSPVIHKKTGACIGMLGGIIDEELLVLNAKRRKSPYWKNKFDYVKFFVMRLDQKMNWIVSDLNRVKEIDFKIKEAADTCSYVEEYVIRYSNKFDRFNLLMGTTFFDKREGLDELKKLVYDFNAMGKGAGINGMTDIKWETNMLDFLAKLIKLMHSQIGYIENTKANKIFPKDATPVKEKLIRQKAHLERILKNMR